MQFFRELIKHKKLTGLLLFGLLLRSLIATGFMLDTSSANDSLFTITICDGPAGINSIANLSEKSEVHEHHHVDDNEQHDHSVEDHGMSACSFWSSSSQSLLAVQAFIDVKDPRLSDETVIYQTRYRHLHTHSSLHARAPPLLS